MLSGKLKTLAWMCVTISLGTLSACATTTGSVAPIDPNAFCLIAQPIRWSSSDTDETIRQAKEHNAVGKRVCGWGATQ